ncbi:MULTISPECIES: endodeoxyribonuclease [Pseudomonas]|uniref:endodeoxyribonuclease n=1 Tax=Pseudomonas TaxID=286 RepID=UPI000C28BCC2|nr:MULTISPECIES: endodeoxyribonuclease [Pseudomonas]
MATNREAGLRLGFRSGLEEKIARELDAHGIEVQYETEQIRYVKPAREAKYTPDWILPNGIIVETKGRFVVEDRQKHLIIKEQHPGLDVRFVFSNSRTRISKNSKTTYAMWCEKYGFLFADKSIPEAWLKEPHSPERWAALENARVKKK